MEIDLPQDPAKPLLGIYPKVTSLYHRDTCSAMLTDALFIVARNWKHPRCPLMEEQIKKGGPSTTVEYYSTIKMK